MPWVGERLRLRAEPFVFRRSALFRFSTVEDPSRSRRVDMQGVQPAVELRLEGVVDGPVPLQSRQHGQARCANAHGIVRFASGRCARVAGMQVGLVHDLEFGRCERFGQCRPDAISAGWSGHCTPFFGADRVHDKRPSASRTASSISWVSRPALSAAPSFYFGVTNDLLYVTVPWLQLNSLGAVILLHPNTDEPRPVELVDRNTKPARKVETAWRLACCPRFPVRVALSALSILAVLTGPPHD